MGPMMGGGVTQKYAVSAHAATWIRLQAIRDGSFDDLPGSGKPLPRASLEPMSADVKACPLHAPAAAPSHAQNHMAGSSQSASESHPARV